MKQVFATPRLARSTRHVKIWMIAAVVAFTVFGCEGDPKTASGTPTPRTSRLSSVHAVPTKLPAGFGEKVHFGCVRADDRGRQMMVLGYRSDDRYSTRDYQETALLRIFVFEGARMHEILEDADEGSVQPRRIRDTEGREFRKTTTEPWPVLVWEEGPVTIQILGEGLDEAAVALVAAGLSGRSEAQFRALVGASSRC